MNFVIGPSIVQSNEFLFLLFHSPASATPEGQSVSWADQMDDLEASVITPGLFIIIMMYSVYTFIPTTLFKSLF